MKIKTHNRNNTNSFMNRRQMAALAGMMGPILFVSIFTVEGWLRPNYQSSEMFVSALSLGPRGWIQIANFMVFGILLLVFAWGVAIEFNNGKKFRAGSTLLVIVALCYLFSGPFVMDPTGTLPNQMSLHGTLHGIFGGIVFLLMPICCFFFLRRFREDPRWRSYQGSTIAAGTIITAAVVLLTVATKLPMARDVFIDWVGLFQRTAIVIYMIWLFTFALGLHRRNNLKGSGLVGRK